MAVGVTNVMTAPGVFPLDGALKQQQGQESSSRPATRPLCGNTAGVPRSVDPNRNETGYWLDFTVGYLIGGDVLEAAGNLINDGSKRRRNG